MLPPFVMAAELNPLEHSRRPAFHLEYVASPGCPNREDFVASVLRRLSRVPRPSDAIQLEFRVEFAQSGERTAGSLSVRARSTSTDDVARSVPPAACPEVAEALALMMALMVDEQLAAQHARTDAPAARDERARPAAVVGARAPDAPPQSGRTFVEQASSYERASGETAVAQAPRWGGAAAGGIESGLAGSVMPAFSVGVALQFVASSIFAPSFRAHLVYGEAGVTTPEGGAIFRLLTSRFNACPVQLRLGWANVNGCAVMDAGTLRASGTDATFWVAAGGGVRAEVSLSRSLKLEGFFDVRAPLRGYRFFSAHSTFLVHEVPAWTTSASIGVSAWGL